ncbi:CHY zinc finger-domain-containing protein [Lophiotrema nucula]|uniref:CHY zinc finger-domain-containing protein n=1 Tax=Lophiotrema nucula TaxID=690887 RepID=A0A6A5ZES0_9PLEO|nr:CHY zinc finger-domain-containing protein [Lophiotrema nucula]
MTDDTPSGTGRGGPLDSRDCPDDLEMLMAFRAIGYTSASSTGHSATAEGSLSIFWSKVRSGTACPFRHEVSDTAQQSTAAVQPARRSQASGPLQQPESSEDPARSPIVQSRSSSGRQQAVNTSRITQRPLPQSQQADPRGYELLQLRRRFTPVEEHAEDGSTTLTFHLRPSDPDFPFEMDALHCTLRVPSDYPSAGFPTLRVTNSDMARGYQINVERGFDQIVVEAKSSSLLNHLNALDRRLESLLSSQKADTIKIVSHSRRPDKAHTELFASASGTSPLGPQAHFQASTTASQAIANPVNPDNIVQSAEEQTQARSIRAAETRQLESRLGRLPQYSKSSDGLAYTIPLEPRRRKELPSQLQAVKCLRLIVPETYNSVPCRIELVGVIGDAKLNVEERFRERAAESPQISLLNHVNYLSQNIHTMAKDQPKTRAVMGIVENSLPQLTISQPLELKETQDTLEPNPSPQDPDRPHILTIPRPLEWQASPEDEAESSDSYSEDDDEFEAHEHTTGSDEQTLSAAGSTPEKGILVSFPHLEMFGIELLEIGTLNITVKCDRCKQTNDVAGLRNNADGKHALTESCRKCASQLTIGFRAELMHTNSIRAGYLDLDGCTVIDMLPSAFVPTCAECSATYAQVGVNSVRGDTSMAFCRECHRKMIRASQAPARKKRPESLGIVAGQELPNRGRCSHYKKSYRWFRFSCCNKVFPCDSAVYRVPSQTKGGVDVGGDRCHDEASDHDLEHANRMICGFCSREQNYRPKDCGICHAFLTVRPGKGFWEGGQGLVRRPKNLEEVMFVDVSWPC